MPMIYGGKIDPATKMNLFGWTEYNRPKYRTQKWKSKDTLLVQFGIILFSQMLKADVCVDRGLRMILLTMNRN